MSSYLCPGVRLRHSRASPSRPDRPYPRGCLRSPLGLLLAFFWPSFDLLLVLFWSYFDLILTFFFSPIRSSPSVPLTNYNNNAPHPFLQHLLTFLGRGEHPSIPIWSPSNTPNLTFHGVCALHSSKSRSATTTPPT